MALIVALVRIRVPKLCPEGKAGVARASVRLPLGGAWETDDCPCFSDQSSESSASIRCGLIRVRRNPPL